MSKYKKYLIANDGNISDTIEIGVALIETDSSTKDWSGDKLASYSLIEKQLKALSGRILTIIDASLPEGKQNKCVKDLIRKEFIHEFEMIADMMLDKNRIERYLDSIDENNIEIVSAKEVLGN